MSAPPAIPETIRHISLWFFEQYGSPEKGQRGTKRRHWSPCRGHRCGALSHERWLCPVVTINETGETAQCIWFKPSRICEHLL